MNIRVEPERNSKTEIKRRGSLRDGFGCGVREEASAKKRNESIK